MTKLSRLKLFSLVVLALVLSAMSSGYLYFSTTREFEEKASFANFEQTEFPSWAYCDRNVEYFLEGEDCSRCVKVFHDSRGRLAEGERNLLLPVVARKESDGYPEVSTLGPRKVQAKLVHGLLEGPLKIFFENGKVALECSYHNGLREGICRNHAPTGWLMNEVEYSAGQKTGTFKASRQDGTRLSEGQGDTCQEYNIWGTNATKKVSPGQAQTFGCTRNKKDIISEGPFVRHLEYVGFGKDGQPVMSATAWDYASGLADHSRIYREMVVNDKMHRQETFLWDLHVVEDFDQAGMLRRELHSRDGKLDGTARWYDGRGVLRLEGTHKNGLRDGLFTWYRADGRAVWSTIYTQGKLWGNEAFVMFFGWTFFLLVLISIFGAFYPTFIWLRNRTKFKALVFAATVLIMLGLFATGAFLSFLVLSNIYF